MFWMSNILSPNHCDKSGAGFQFLDQLIDVHWQFAGHFYFSPTHFCHRFGSRYYEQDDLRQTAFPTLGMNFAHLAPYGWKNGASEWLEMVKNVWYCVSCQPRVLCFENKMVWSITIHKLLFQLWPWKIWISTWTKNVGLMALLGWTQLYVPFLGCPHTYVSTKFAIWSLMFGP